MVSLRREVEAWAARTVNRATSLKPVETAITGVSLSRHELKRECTRLHEFAGEERFSFERPAHLGHMPDEISRILEVEHAIERPFVCELRNVELVGPRGMTITEGGRYVLETSAIGYPRLLAQNIALTAASGVVPVRRNTSSAEIDTAVSLVGSWTSGYFHWFSDWLARLDVLERYEERTGVEPTVILPRDATDWMRDSIARTGIDRNRCIEWDGSRLRVRTLVIPSIPRRTDSQDANHPAIYSKRAYRWIRQQILDTIELRSDLDPAANVFVSRADATNRRVLNEEPVLDDLTDRNFQSYTLSALTFPQQVALFHNAETVVAPHGAGLTNVLFCEGAKVLELFGSLVNPCYLALCQHLDLEYGFIQGEAVGEDVRTDAARVVRMLDELG